MLLDKTRILEVLKMTGELLVWDGCVEILLVGGAAGVLTGVLDPKRTTADCDVMNLTPSEASGAIFQAVKEVSERLGLPEDWFNDKVCEVGVLPYGWRSRRHRVAVFDRLVVYAIARKDLLCMKFYSLRPQDREDIAAMGMNKDEVQFVKYYLSTLKFQNRQFVDLDRIQAAEKYLSALGYKD